MPVETFEVRCRERGPRKGSPEYAVPPDQSIRLLGRVSLDGLWPRDLPLLFLVLGPRETWGEAPREWELYVASLLSTHGGPAQQYRHQPEYFEFGVASWLRDRREPAFVELLRESLPLGTFPVFLKDGYRGAGWMDEEPRNWPRDLGAGAAMTRPVDLYLPEGPTWGQ
jgi:hypothetical protein